MRVVNTMRVAQMGRGDRLAHAERAPLAVNTIKVASMGCEGLAGLLALNARSSDGERWVKRGAPERRASQVGVVGAVPKGPAGS